MVIMINLLIRLAIIMQILIGITRTKSLWEANSE